MPYVNAEQKARAREVSLLDWLQAHEPDNLTYRGGGEYFTNDHRSLTISHGKWYWHNQGFGGFSALDYLVKVRKMPFPDAVLATIDGSAPPSIRAPASPRREFQLPEKHSDNRRVFAYLRARGIDPEIINHMIKHGHLYEDAKRHNAVFVGRNAGEIPRYAALRGTYSNSTFVGEQSGSEKKIGFSVSYGGDTLHIYESAIDLLSFLTMKKLAGVEWKTGAHLSLGSAHKSPKLPAALERYLQDYPRFSTIILLLDNDETGRCAAKNIAELLPDKTVLNRFPKGAKDLNELLQSSLGIRGRVKTRGGDAR